MEAITRIGSAVNHIGNFLKARIFSASQVSPVFSILAPKRDAKLLPRYAAARKAAEFGARSTPLDAYPSTPSSLSRAPSSLGTHSDSTSLTSSQRSRRPSFGSMTSEGWSPPRSESSVSTARPVRMGDASSSLFGPRPAGADRPLPKRSVELEKALARARAALNYPRAPPPDAASFRRLELESRKKDEEIAKRIRAAKRKKLPEQLPARHAALVKSYMHDRGFSAKVGREMVTAKDIGRLGPASWLNDEIINLWGAMIMERAEKHKKAAKAGAAGTRIFYTEMPCFNRIWSFRY